MNNFPTKFFSDAIISPILGKQRHIPLFRFFSPLSLIITLLGLSFIGMIFLIHTTLSKMQGFPVIPHWFYFIGYGIGFLPFAIVYSSLKKQQNFYEYAIRTVALIITAQVETCIIVRERNSNNVSPEIYTETYTVVFIEYQFLSSSEDNIFYGSCDLQDTPTNRELKKGDKIAIVYHAKRPDDSRLLTPKDKKYIH